MATLPQLRRVLDSAGEPYHLLDLHNGMRALLTQRGARVLGLFPDPEAENLFWTNAALNSASDFRAFADAGGWNLGGERCWISPEIQFNTSDREAFFDTLSVDPAMDPGAYSLAADADGARLEQTLTLTAHNLASGEKSLRVTRTIRPVANPLPDSALGGALYAGYEQTATLTELDDAPILSAIWNLIQLNAGGKLLIPVYGEVESALYFGSAPDEAYQARDGHLRINITGKRQFKVGYAARCITGRMGYLNRLPDGREYLLVRLFFNNPSNPYPDEPPDQPGVNGHAVHVYNDGGEFGGDVSFGEMECSGQTIGAQTGKTSATDTFVLWAYVGEPAAIRRITTLLLGVTP